MTIETARLALVPLDRDALARLAAGQDPGLGFDPNGAFDDALDVVRVRLAQIEEDPAAAPWLVRAIVLRAERRAVGFITFHAPPDARGMVEIGYEVLPAYRRRGYAREAAAALLAWARDHGARTVRASVSPDNVASRAMLAGYVQVGEQLDEVDGLELVFEKPL